jgi:hypothetical protein
MEVAVVTGRDGKIYSCYHFFAQQDSGFHLLRRLLSRSLKDFLHVAASLNFVLSSLCR